MFHNVQGQYIHNALPHHTMLHAPTVELLTDAKFLYDTLPVHLAQTTESYKANQSRKMKKVTYLRISFPLLRTQMPMSSG